MRKGINVYEEARFYFGRGDESEKLHNFSGSGKPPCVFLSHRSADKAAVKGIGDYITNAGINIYMDIDDPALQAAVASDDHDAITLFIERGIITSTDLMVCMSAETFDSCWVPYEIGFGKRDEKHLSALRLNDIPKLPSYLNIHFVDQLDGVGDLNAYLKKVKNRGHGTRHFSGSGAYSTSLREDAELKAVLPSFSSFHSLRNFLDE